jgi:hypothetical protein
MKKALTLTICATVLFLTSCVSSRIVMLANTTSLGGISNPDEVTIFIDAADLPTEYQKIAIITTSYVSGMDKAKWRRVRERCAEIGANGVYTQMENRASGGAKVAAAIFGTVASDKAEFIAIRYNKQQTKIQPVEAVVQNPVIVQPQSKSLISQPIASQLVQTKVPTSYDIGKKVRFQLENITREGVIVKIADNILTISWQDNKGNLHENTRYKDKVTLID